MSDLLKEAIADAKAIREIAIENAKASLAETFAPKIKKMVMEKMDAEESLYEEDDEMEKMMKEEDMEDLEEMDFQLEGEGEEMSPESKHMQTEEDDMEEEEFEEEDELEEILRELEMPEDETNEAYGEDDSLEEDLFLELSEEEGEEAPAAPVKKAPAPKKDDSQLEQFIREMIAEIEGEGEEMEEGYGKEDKEMEAMKEEMEEKEQELQEAYKTIKFLREKINESLLINSKLLYSGKLFRAYNLDENQKISILESFDRASSIRETKLLYASLATTLNELRSKVSNKSHRLKESRASKSTITSTKPSQKILEENKMVSRLQQLAGIIK